MYLWFHNQTLCPQVSWEEQKRIQEQSMTTLQSRCQELEKQNNLLHEQIEKVQLLLRSFMVEKPVHDCVLCNCSTKRLDAINNFQILNVNVQGMFHH